MFMGFGFIFTLLLIGAIVYALGWRPQGQNNLLTSPDSTQSVLDITKERYARGEINQEEFEQIRHDLSN